MQAACGPAVWRGADQDARDWIVPIEADEGDELVRAALPWRGRPLQDLTRDQFAIPTLLPKLATAAHTLEHGRGFVMFRGLPAERLPQEVVEVIYWGIGLHLGVGVSQSAAGDRLGHVFDRGAADQERYYTRGGALEFHMDPVDVVGLLCLRTALSGGASRIVSAGEVHNVILAERPDLLRILRRGFHNSRRGHGQGTSAAPVPVFADAVHGLECYFLPQTIRQAAEEGYPLSALEKEAIALIGAVANRSGLYLDMDFRMGDIQFLSNRTILHARTDYVDPPEPERKRHLLRLWLMMPQWPPRPAAMVFHDRVDQAGGGVRPRGEDH
jgi:hypothetical protein